MALALIVLPGTLVDLIVPQATPGTSGGAGWFLLSVLVLLIGIVGQLTVSRIALGTRTSVGEAMAHGARRTPVFLLATMIWLLPFVLIASPFAFQLQANPAQPPPIATLALLLVSLAVLFVAVRLLFSTPLAVGEPLGAVRLLERSWALTAGHWWRLFGFLVLFMLAALIALAAVTSVVGVVIGLISGAPDRLSVGALVIALISQVMAAIITVLLTVMLTRLYLQRVAGEQEPASVPHAP